MSLSVEAALLHRVTWPFQSEGRVGLAVSGGGDSMAMLWLIGPWARSVGREIRVVTVDHGLRPEAKEEAALVARACAAIGVSHDVLEWRGWDKRGNLQARARDARRRLIVGWAAERGIGTVALAHTRDDQAETVLLRLARGSGVDGLSGMAAESAASGIRWVRPLLGERREDLRALLRASGHEWAEDPSNTDARFDRVRARTALDTLATLGIDAEGIAATAERMRGVRVALEHYEREAIGALARVEGGDVVLARPGFDLLPEETRLRVMARAIGWVGGAVYRPRLAALRAAMEGEGRTLQGAMVVRRREGWRVSREFAAVRDLCGRVGEVWDGRWSVEGEAGDVRALGEALAEVPDWRAAGLPRTTLMVSPAVWRQGALIAAPVAGFGRGWTARIVAPFGD
jgi:tRNA(Ile)-lysidine synthase